LYREHGDPNFIATTVANLSEVLIAQGDHIQARLLAEEGLALSREQGNRLTSAFSLIMLGKAATAQGALARAAAYFEESLALFQVVHFKRGVAEALEKLALVACTAGAGLRAARLLAVAEELREASHTPLPPADRASYERTIATVQAMLGSAAFAAAWSAGRAMTPEEAIATPDSVTAFDDSAAAPQPAAQPAPRPSYPAGLTEREVEVLRLLAQGLSYAEIAERLVISPRTVNRHLTTIYGKLDVTSRHAATQLAIQYQLI
jgi:DNA-binding CsgD family transcriptional regulator